MTTALSLLTIFTVWYVYKKLFKRKKKVLGGWFLSVILLVLQGCVCMSPSNLAQIKDSKRRLGRMEGLSKCGDDFNHVLK